MNLNDAGQEAANAADVRQNGVPVPDHTPDAGRLSLERGGMSDLMVDLWRIQKRAQRDPATSEGVHIACERALERAHALGFTIEEMIGEAYHANMNLRVAHRDGGEQNLRISECLSPAVYFTPAHSTQKQLIRKAEVVLQGE